MGKITLKGLSVYQRVKRAKMHNSVCYQVSGLISANFPFSGENHTTYKSIYGHTDSQRGKEKGGGPLKGPAAVIGERKEKGINTPEKTIPEHLKSTISDVESGGLYRQSASPQGLSPETPRIWDQMGLSD